MREQYEKMMRERSGNGNEEEKDEMELESTDGWDEWSRDDSDSELGDVVLREKGDDAEEETITPSEESSDSDESTSSGDGG